MISVIVPIYNAEKYLKECLDSIANQTYKDIEVILVNDGSTDGSKKICEEYLKKYQNFHLYNKENGGQMSAWMLGVEKSSGDFFGFVDSDDYITKDMYEKMAQVQATTGADIVMCGRINKSTEQEEIERLPFEGYYEGDQLKEVRDYILPSFRGNLSQARWDKIFRRDLYIHNIQYCTYQARTFEDRFIVPACFFGAKSIAFINEPFYYWRKMKVSSSRKYRPELCELIEILYASQTQMLLDYGYLKDYQEKLEVAKLDYIRMVVERNLCANIPYKQKWETAQNLLTAENRRIVLNHKKQCLHKFGKYIYWTYKLNSKTFMLLGAVLLKAIKKKEGNGYE